MTADGNNDKQQQHQEKLLELVQDVQLHKEATTPVDVETTLKDGETAAPDINPNRGVPVSRCSDLSFKSRFKLYFPHFRFNKYNNYYKLLYTCL